MSEKKKDKAPAKVGHNSLSGRQLVIFCERLEHIRAQKKGLSADEAAIRAEAKQAGYSVPALNFCLKVRAMKPHDRQENFALQELYLGHLGLADPGPLFRAVETMKVDVTAKEEVLGALKQLVPSDGEIIVRVGGVNTRLFRDKDGQAQVEDQYELPQSQGKLPGDGAAAKQEPPPPDVDEAGAKALGLAAYNNNHAITENPFPFGDKRRAQWDAGWREASGSDGMGPPE